MVDEHKLAAGHLRAAMAAMVQRGDTLAVAMIAQALGTVERATGAGAATALGEMATANRRPC